MLNDPASIALAAFFSFLGIVISIYQILCHLRNYTEPVFQRYIIRIIFMVPVYAIGSFCSLQWRHGAIYFDTLRDCYEAWIIYNFSALLLAYVGGPGAVVVKAEGKVVHPSWVHLTCCLPAMQVDGFFLRRCKQGTVQFVLLKPVMAALVLILYAGGAYTDGDMSPSDGYFYISIMYNVCYTLALYGLILFWNGASELLQPFNPLLKFILVKTVVFLTFWQGIGISAINSMGKISDPEDGKALQNFMICTEMALAGIALLYAFPHKEYQIGGTTNAFRLDAFTHAISINDVVKDAIHVFAPSYSDYVLYSDGGPADNVKRKKFRGQKGTGGDHPKAGKPMTKVDESVMDSDGRRSKTPNGGGKLLEANRNQAILLDSDSDGMDSEDEGSVVCGTESDDEVSAVGSMSTSFTSPAGRADSASAGSTAPSTRATPRPTGENAAEAKRQLQKRASSKRVRKAGASRVTQEQLPGQADNGLIKASYPADPVETAVRGRADTATAAAPPAAAAATKAVFKANSRRALPLALRYHGAILSDSDSDDDMPAATAAADAGQAGLLRPGHIDSASTAAATQAEAAAAPVPPRSPPAALPIPPRAVVLVAPPTRGKAAAVRQAVAGAAQAAGRAMAAAQATSSRQAGDRAVVAREAAAITVGGSSSPIVLAPPKHSALTAAGAEGGGADGAAASPRSPAAVRQPWDSLQAAAAWEPVFPGSTDGHQGQQQEGSWAEGGWANVAL